MYISSMTDTYYKKKTTLKPNLEIKERNSRSIFEMTKSWLNFIALEVQPDMYLILIIQTLYSRKILLHSNQ